MPNAMLETLNSLKPFIGPSQRAALEEGLHDTEAAFFEEKVQELAARVASMPKAYEQDGAGDAAVAYLHYFRGDMDWYITEKDLEQDQQQAFGLVNFGHGWELGYVNLEEVTQAAELDLYWQPVTLKAIKERAR